MKPVVIDLCCGLGGWSEGFLAEGYECIGYDVEAHDYGTGGYPGTLILQDITQIHGSRFKDAAVIVASPPCQKYSYMAMPWKLGKAKAAAIEADTTGQMKRDLNLLFDTCFRLQREASEAAGHHIPMIVENVRGAQRWVGRAVYNYGSFYLWGDVPALMPKPLAAQKSTAGSCKRLPGASGGRISGWPHTDDSVKIASVPDSRRTIPAHIQAQKEARVASGTKPVAALFGSGCDSSMSRMYSSKSTQRKMSSAMIAKIPLPLSQHIARTFKPHNTEIARVA